MAGQAEPGDGLETLCPALGFCKSLRFRFGGQRVTT